MAKQTFMNKKRDSDMLSSLAKYLIGETGTPYDMAGNKMGYTPVYDDNNAFKEWNTNGQDLDLGKTDKLVDKYTAMQDTTGGVSANQLLGLTGQAISQHPLKSAGLAALGMGNLGGLTDNNKFGGQLGGLGLRYLATNLLEDANPYAKIMLTLGGGELGSLFDKLRARKEQERQQQTQTYGGR
jgi:hypothetical protein